MQTVNEMENGQAAGKNMSKINTRELAVMALLSAILLGCQVAFAALPNIEVVSLLIFIFAQIYQKKVFFIIYVFVVLEGCIYGFGLWWFGYLYVWSILAIVAILMKEKQTTLIVTTIVLGAYGLAYGFLFAIPYFLISGFEAGVAYWVSGIPFDILHCIGNVATALILYHPLRSLLGKLDKGTACS